MDYSMDPLDPRHEELFNRRSAELSKPMRNKVLADSLSSQPTYAIVTKQPPHMDLMHRTDLRDKDDLKKQIKQGVKIEICDNAERHDKCVARLTPLPDCEDVFHLQILMTYIADRLTNPKDVDPPNPKPEPRYEVSPAERVNDEWLQCTITQRDYDFPLAVFKFLETEQHTLEAALENSLYDLERTVDNLATPDYHIKPRPSPSP